MALNPTTYPKVRACSSVVCLPSSETFGYSLSSFLVEKEFREDNMSRDSQPLVNEGGILQWVFLRPRCVIDTGGAHDEHSRHAKPAGAGAKAMRLSEDLASFRHGEL